MNDNINSLTKIEEEILNYDISDEALETVAGGGEGGGVDACVLHWVCWLPRLTPRVLSHSTRRIGQTLS